MRNPGDVEAGNRSTAAATIHFDLKPGALIAHLDQYVVKQEQAKAILATKICTHFNRIRQSRETKPPSRRWWAASRTMF
jgi:ATP-dependent protease Clp ATPase subunit